MSASKPSTSGATERSATQCAAEHDLIGSSLTSVAVDLELLAKRLARLRARAEARRVLRIGRRVLAAAVRQFELGKQKRRSSERR